MFLMLLIALVFLVCLSLLVGAADIAPSDIVRSLISGPLLREGDLDHFVVWNIRLPRTFVAISVGAALALCGAALQGMFRNPLADPALIGITAGGALGAVIAMLSINAYTSYFNANLSTSEAGLWVVPFFAFLGALLVTAVVYQLSRLGGRVSVAHMLLVGIAMNSLCGAVTGFLIVKANDQQLREITFWTLGGLGFVTTHQLWAIVIFVILPLGGFFLCIRGLNALMLGEAEAFSMGINLDRLKSTIIFCGALSVGAAVAFTGGIGFVGLVAPHLVRLAIGGDHRFLLPGAALMGGVLLGIADLLARTLTAPAELPVGIITAAIGAPFFLFLLLRSRSL